MSIHMNFYKFMSGSETKITKNTNNLFKQQFLMHRVDNIMSVHMNLHEFMRRYNIKITYLNNNF
jgi:hypothetical protein